MQTLVPADAPPLDHLGLEPAIGSCAELSRALEELSWLSSRTATRVAAMRQQIDLAKWHADKEMVVEVDGVPVRYADRMRALDEAVRAFCLGHRDDLLAGLKVKTRKLTHGEISFREQPARVALADGVSELEVFAAVDKKLGLWDKLVALLRRLKLAAKVRLDAVVTVKRSLNLDALTDAWKRGELTPAMLEKYGLTVVSPGEKVSVKLHDYELVQERTQSEDDAA